MAKVFDYKEGVEEFVKVETVTSRKCSGIEDIIPAKFLTKAYLEYIKDEAAKRGVLPGMILADELRAHEALKAIDLQPRLRLLEDAMK